MVKRKDNNNVRDKNLACYLVDFVEKHLKQPQFCILMWKLHLKHKYIIYLNPKVIKQQPNGT